MAWPAWIVSALAHPEVRRVGVEAATKAGGMLAERLGKRKGGTEILPPEEGQPSDADLLREAMESLPTKQELAEAIAALDAQSEARVARLRGTVILLAIAQFVALAVLIAVLI
ncbi:hypothetical protein [Parasphingopyxis sp.]|uniref:hypothetical protein n=1 Tax=Parasphingopyxis sp. TaxID=1920299 RepID=UPI00260A7278|nr:hypothetical protein [Parasphingopyxis sp.]